MCSTWCVVRGVATAPKLILIIDVLKLERRHSDTGKCSTADWVGMTFGDASNMPRRVKHAICLEINSNVIIKVVNTVRIANGLVASCEEGSIKFAT